MFSSEKLVWGLVLLGMFLLMLKLTAVLVVTWWIVMLPFVVAIGWIIFWFVAGFVIIKLLFRRKT